MTKLKIYLSLFSLFGLLGLCLSKCAADPAGEMDSLPEQDPMDTNEENVDNEDEDVSRQVRALFLITPVLCYKHLPFIVLQ